MHDSPPRPPARFLSRVLLAAAMCVTVTAAQAAGPGDALRTKYAALSAELERNAFQRPLVIRSSHGAGNLRGEVYAVVDHPFGTVERALRAADQWCEVLILPFNVKHCRAGREADAQKLALHIGRKHDQPVSSAYQVNFAYRLAAASPEHLEVLLTAPTGPMGTHDYRISFEAVALDAKRSFMHISYSYGFGFAARLAMKGYLGTVGRDKIGFTVVDRRPDGQPVHVGDMRGVIERNTMRYYLAIDAYLDSLAAPPHERRERRMREWFTATERYPRQLHEMELAEYLSMKRKEVARLRADTHTAKAD
ncbi:MAG TPA: hypothetical protein VGE16_16160 [Albitalea sp.]